MKKCPFCAEEIQSEAIKCRFCGEMLPEETHEEPFDVSDSRDEKPSRTKGCLKWGCLSLLAATLLLLLIGLVGGACEDAERKRQYQARKQFLEKEFTENRESILASVAASLEKGELEAAISQAEKYAALNDPDLKELGDQAGQALAERNKAATEQAKQEETQKILEELREIPASDLSENKQRYLRLTQLHPDNADYKEKLGHYSAALEKRIAEQQRTRRLERKWSYRSSTDPMTSGTTRQASIQSENTVSFDFPYRGPQHGTLILRDHPSHGRDVILSIERGQILCRSYEDCNITIRFDQKSPTRWRAVGPSDNSTDTIFIRNSAEFRRRMRSADAVRIQIPVYQEGNVLFEFEVGGFSQSRFTE